MRGNAVRNLNNIFTRWKGFNPRRSEKLFSTNIQGYFSHNKSALLGHRNYDDEPLLPKRLLSSTTVNHSSTSGDSNPDDLILIKTDKNIRTIVLNRPAKKNALTTALFKGLAKAVTDANNDPATDIIVWTGMGDYFCAGADTKERAKPEDPSPFKILISAFIECKKPIIVIVNGPAVGIGVTLLGHVDAVYATDLATFWTPFSQLGICAEACSSYTFPRIMGYSKANDMLMFGAKFTASQAEQCGLITYVFPQNRLEEEAWTRIKTMAQLPTKSLLFTKELVRGPQRETLHKVNAMEGDRIAELRNSNVAKF